MKVFVSPTALRRFTERVDARLHDEEIIGLIQAGCDRPHRQKATTRDDGAMALTVRIKGQIYRGREYEYRCVIVPAHKPGGWPVVATVLQGRWRVLPEEQ